MPLIRRASFGPSIHPGYDFGEEDNPMNGKCARFRTRWLLTLLGVGLLLGAVSCQKAAHVEDEGDDEEGSEEPVAGKLPAEIFQDVTARSGVDFTYRNGESKHYAILESLGGGVALIDYDGDGLLDIFLTGGGYFAGKDGKQIKGYPCKLYRNLGNGKFQDVTKEVGLDQPLFYNHGAAVCDYDRDGWPDLLVTGYGRLALYHNEPVDADDPRKGRRFREVTREVGLLEGGHYWSTSAAFADLDGDGWPDLYVCQYVNWGFGKGLITPPCPGYTTEIKRDVCPPRQFDSLPHALYHNVAGPDGKRRFVNVSREAGLRVPVRADKDYGKGLGVVIVDVNGDGKPDIFVANDTTDDFLYVNQSTPGKLRFKEVGLPVGVARDGGGSPTGSMGVDAGDYDGRGLASLFVTTYEGELHSLFRNIFDGRRLFFEYATQVSGLSALGQQFVGFGTGFLDLDNDGWEDLVIINGHVIRHPARAARRQRPVLMRNLGDGKFASVSKRGGPYFQADHVGRGLAIGDMDNDGRPDLVVSHVNDPVAVLRHAADVGHHWLGIELVGQEYRDVVGARLTLEVGGRHLTRFARGGGSYLSSGDRRHLFGLGTTTRVGRLTVEWPSGEPRKQHWEGLATDRYWRLVQGKKEPVIPPGGRRAR
jgi:hypothetical protein